MILDSQVHTYDRNHPGRPWLGALPGAEQMTGEDMIVAMDAVGVDGALVVSPFAVYGYDTSYVATVHAAHPDRFALIAPIDSSRRDVADVVAEWAATPGAVGIRVSALFQRGGPGVDDPLVHEMMRAAALHGMPACLPVQSRPDGLLIADDLARSYPENQLVLDHLGLQQPGRTPAPQPEPWAQLPEVLALAQYPNVAMKVSGATTLSHESYPYGDIWEPLGRIFEAYGFDRCMWGTDWTRAVPVGFSYADAIGAFRDTDRLTADERATLLGDSLQRIFDWWPSKPT